MEKVRQIAICGGDQRQQFLAEALRRDGFSVWAWGLSGLPLAESIRQVPLEELFWRCDCFILPLPATVDGETLFAPHSETVLSVKNGLAKQLTGKTVFVGLPERLVKADPAWADVDCRDYSKQESFAVRNAFPTAEGALAIAIQESDRTIRGARCLVTGFGRIGQVLSRMLRDLGADVTVAARRTESLTWAECLGYHPVSPEMLARDLNYDFIFNTIPAMVFSETLLRQMPSRCVAVELASAPWGFDFAAGKRLSKTIIKAPALPGRFSPRTAGEIIKDTILTMMEE